MTEAVPAPAAKGRGRVAIRVAITAALALLLVWKVPLKGVGAALGQVPASGLALALVVMGFQLVTGVLRWKRMLARTGVIQPLSALIVDTLVASAYNLVLPSAVGGDFVRAYRCSKRIAGPEHAWSTTLFERVIGIVCLALVATPGMLAVPGGRTLLAPALVLAAVAVLILVAADRPLGWLAKLALARAPALAALSTGVAADLRGPLGRPGARAEALAWSLLYQFLGLSILTACVVPTGDWRLVTAIYSGLPLIAIASMLPVTIGGLGLRESLFVVVLGRLGVAESLAFALALLWLASYVVLAAVGVGAVLLTKDRPVADTTKAL